MNIAQLKTRIGESLKEIRELNNLTQEQLANRAGCSKSYISEIENGKTEPRMSKLSDLLKSCGRQYTLKRFFNEYF